MILFLEDSMWDRIKGLHPWGLVCFALAAFLVYGTELIIRHVLKVAPEKAAPHRIALKTVGLGMGVVGLLLLMDII